MHPVTALRGQPDSDVDGVAETGTSEALMAALEAEREQEGP